MKAMNETLNQLAETLKNVESKYFLMRNHVHSPIIFTSTFGWSRGNNCQELNSSFCILRSQAVFRKLRVI
jgi:hypothetical protein